MAKVWKRKDRGVWVADFRNASGRRVRLTAATREQAEPLLAQKIREPRQRRPVSLEDPDIKLRDYGSSWLARVEPDLETKTYQGYKQHLDQHISPHLGN